MARRGNIKPLALTMGEPAGIGPELVGRLWQERKTLDLSPFLYVGSPDAIAAVIDVPTKVISEPSQTISEFSQALPCWPVELDAPVTLGETNQANGAAVLKSIQTSVNLALNGEVSGIVTAPIHKAALYKAGFDSPGHTEYLARLCGLPDDSSVMMLTAQDLRVVPVTIHIPLREVPKELTADKIFRAGAALAHDLKTRFGIKSPRIAVAGLNPHAGESGTIGMEEATHIMPAIWRLRDEGIEVSDPKSADTLFHEKARQAFDAVLCMYHDQALIPVKTLDFWGGVNVTLGLPIIRTSPDHGTALELAGTGKCRPDSMVAAVKLAQRMAEMEQAHAE